MSVSLAAGLATASAQGVELPTRSGSAPQAAAPAPEGPAAQPPPPPPAPPAPVASLARPKAAPAVLKLGSYGRAVRDLQRELRRRGIKVVVDGAYGPGTRAAVKKIQRRLKMRPTGIADAKLLKRLGLTTRAVAAAPVTTVAPVATGQDNYLRVFPVAAEHSFFDDFGAARHQGRHEGNDIMADAGAPIVAVDDGVVDRLSRAEQGLGGIYVWLERKDGTQYYFAHMSSVAAGLKAGSRVTAGQPIGTVGNTGDARGGAAHLHFEIRVNQGRTPINPYTHLVAVDIAPKGSPTP